MKNTITPFWEKPKGSKIFLKHNEYIKFLDANGFKRMTDKPGDPGILVKIENNIVRLSSDSEIINVTADYLKSKGEVDVLEVFTRQAPSYVNKTKQVLLESVPFLKHKDSPSVTWLYFINKAVKISKSGISLVEYSNLNHQIWEDDIINHKIESNDGFESDFEKFAFNISNKNDTRFIALQTNIGYLISRYNDPSNPKAIILLDQNISHSGIANGGTGKSLISLALCKVRNTITIDGKKYASNYIFNTQRIDLNTKIVWYDDVRDNFSLEDVYSMLTSGLIIHKKFKSPIHIMPSEAPKILICSNYIVKGTSGNTDKRRRCEFELYGYYNDTFQPIDEFGKLFYTGWDSVEYNRFYWTMIKFAQAFLTEGLIIAKPINLPTNRLIALTSKAFVDFVKDNIGLNNKNDKRVKLIEFNNLLNKKDEVSSHTFTKWLKIYAFEKELVYDDKSTGGSFYFWLHEKNEEEKNIEDEEE